MKTLNKRLAVIISLLLLLGCGEKFPVVEDLSTQSYSLVDQNNDPVNFPDFVKGKLVVINYIFTNCPDICPISTNNMRLIQERLTREHVKNVQFVSLSFDPGFDTPEVLTKFALIRNLDLSNWTFLTGEKNVIGAITKRVGVMVVPNDSTVFKDGRKIYYYVHTDRVQLMDAEGKIRKNYKGSDINIDEIVKDIKKLL
jgi:protein SCO1/2